MHPSFRRTDHRQWPVPRGPWVFHQRWTNLLFAHWPVAAARVRHLVLPKLRIQEFGGTSWAGIVPFRLEALTWRLLPALPYFSRFPEINLRLYVELDEKPGIWFVSLDADNAAAVLGARLAFGLPYWRAAIDVDDRGERVGYRSVRRGDRAIVFDAHYWPTGPATEAKPESLEHFLMERYCLYARTGENLERLEIHHLPWALHPASAEIFHNTLASLQGVPIDPGVPPLLHFSREQDVVAWWPYRC